MRGEFGYMEEGQLGKPYNLRLLKRLSVFIKPYRRIIGIALSFSILITLLNLASPYLTKIAIDRYILSSWYLVNLSEMNKEQSSEFLRKYGHFLDNIEKGSFGIIPHMNTKKMDPSDYYSYIERGIISKKKYYRISPQTREKYNHFRQNIDSKFLSDGSLLISIEDLNLFKPEEIIKIRHEDVNGVTMIGIIIICLLFTTLVIGYAEYYLLEFIGQKIMQDIRLNLFSRMQAQSISFYDRNPVGRLLTRVTNDIENLNEMFKSVLITIFKDFFVIIGILAVAPTIATISPGLT